jgi:hypothetical protein
MSTQAEATPLPLGASVPPGSLRAEMEARRAAGRRFNVREAVAIVVPLCTQLARLHQAGQRLFVHPSILRYTADGGAEVALDQAHRPPLLPRDRACLAREERKGSEGDSRSSVYTMGAILYELLTGHSVGPAMRRPTELVPELPASIEVVLGKALVADPSHRPHDLDALAQALHNLAPGASARPPAADESHLDHDADFEVDVSLSMLPPAPGGIPAPGSLRLAAVHVDGPYAVAIREAAPAPSSRQDPTRRLADLKTALESDPRPRYVVIKDGMDHGPFSAVELLQQIASATFVGDHVLRDAFSDEERAIKDWDEFAPFAEQAKLNRDIAHEKKSLEAVVAAETKTTRTKAVVASTVVGLLVVVIGGSFAYRGYQKHQRELEAQAQQADQVVSEGSLGPATGGKGPGGARGPGGPRPAGGGNYPTLAGSMSCEAAQARYVEEYKMANGADVPPDLTAGAYGAVLNRGSYLNSCGVPSNMEVNICAAVQNGRAVGVTVTTSPSNPGVASCVAGQVRGLPFPSHPRLDVARTTFAAN